MRHTKNAFSREMQFQLHCYTVVSYKALLRLSVFKIPAVYLLGAKRCVFARDATLVTRLWGIKRCVDQGSVQCFKGVECNGIIGKRSCIIPNLGCDWSFNNVAGTYLITHMLCPTLYAAITEELIHVFFKNAVLYFFFKKKSVSLPTRCDVIAISF